MDSSDSSSDEGCNFYVNAARKLHELQQKKKRQLPDTEAVDDDDSNEVPQDNGYLDEVPKSKETQPATKDVECLDESEEDVPKEKGTQNEDVMNEDAVICLDDNDTDELDDDDSSSQNRRRTRLQRKRKANRNKNVIHERIKVVDTVDESFEKLLNDSYDNSFQLSQEENDVNCVMIGSPPPSKKSNDDYEVSVKVLWMSNKMERFDVRRHETFQKIFMHFAKLEGVPEDQIRITNKGKKINPFDTPISVDLTVVDIFDGGFVSAEVAKKKGNSAQDAEAENSCKIKIQTSNVGTLNCTLKKTDTFDVLLRYCSEQLGIAESKMKLVFDGELVDLEDTPETLDLDDENCFDLKISE